MRKNILLKIGCLNENKILVGADDYDTWLRIAHITDQFLYINKKLGYYLFHDANEQKKRDMSTAQRLAIKGFLYLFNNQQKLNLEIIINGVIHLKIKSLFIIILIMLKNMKLK